MDLMSETRVLPNAPLAGYDDDFSTMSMKTFDLVGWIYKLSLSTSDGSVACLTETIVV